MAKIKLPHNTLPDVLPKRRFRDAEPNEEDPLCQAAVAISNGFGYRHLDEHGAAALVALAQRVAFDPNALVEPRSGQPLPLLSYVLGQAPASSGGRPDRPWPIGLEDFGGHLLESSTTDPSTDLVDAEWLAATLVAAGADPWVDVTPEDGVGSAAASVMARGMLGLLKRFLIAPGAPSVAVLAAAHHEGRSWLNRACTQEQEQPLLAFFLDNGVVPGPDEVLQVLEGALPSAVEEFSRRGLLPGDKVGMRRLETAWRQRLRDKALSAADMVRMSGLLSRLTSGNQEDAVRSLKFTQQLAQAWGAESNGSEDHSRGTYGQYASNTGLPELIEQASVSSGRLSGRWSGLAVKLARRLRMASTTSSGVPPFDIGMMVSCIQGSGGKHVGVALRGNQGLLKAAIGFEWRPGLCIDGVVALALLGQVNASPVSPVGHDALAPDLQAAAHLLGVEDMLRWATSHVEAAVAFTEALVSPTAQVAATTLAGVWHMALERHPAWLADRPDLGQRLLSCLHGQFRLDALPRIPVNNVQARRWTKAMTGIVTCLSPAATHPGFVLGKVAAHERWLALEVALMVEDGETLHGLMKIKDLRPQEAQRIQLWADAKLKQGSSSHPEAFLRKMGAWAQTSSLAHAIAVPESPASVRRPRM